MSLPGTTVIRGHIFTFLRHTFRPFIQFFALFAIFLMALLDREDVTLGKDGLAWAHAVLTVFFELGKGSG